MERRATAAGSPGIRLEDPADTEAWAGRLARALGPRLAADGPGSAAWVVHLSGPLGAGKTTFARGVLRALGHRGAVKSPTYTLVEPYELGTSTVYHFDLYRLADPEELEFLGLRDYLRAGVLCLVEWPQRGGEALAIADLDVSLAYDGTARQAVLVARSARAAALLEVLEAGEES